MKFPGNLFAPVTGGTVSGSFGLADAVKLTPFFIASKFALRVAKVNLSLDRKAADPARLH
jgi:hypothetical protein